MSLLSFNLDSLTPAEERLSTIYLSLLHLCVANFSVITRHFSACNAWKRDREHYSDHVDQIRKVFFTYWSYRELRTSSSTARSANHCATKVVNRSLKSYTFSLKQRIRFEVEYDITFLTSDFWVWRLDPRPPPLDCTSSLLKSNVDYYMKSKTE